MNFGHMQFDTTRSEVGDLLFKLKNRADQTVVPDIADTAADFLRSLGEELDILVPVRPSTHRAVQPVTILAEAIGERLNLPVADCVKKTRETPQLKNVYDLDERTKLLSGAFGIDKIRLPRNGYCSSMTSIALARR